ncbi:MAG: DUF4332 domain-containing protein [Acidimicrobiia bacterium]|nr:DUF4332 domain-containing protein [Acidimicrobiia bacterium]
MPYSLDLRTISLRRFAEILTTFEMLPSRKVLADHITSVVAELAQMGVVDLEGLRRLLADKNRYSELAARLGVDESYLTLLNREVNAYRTKPTPLAKLEVFPDDELAALKRAGITSTKHLYDRCRVKDDRASLAADLDVDRSRLETALKMANLVRINGAGPAFARFFLDVGIGTPEDFRRLDPAAVAEQYNTSIADDPSQPKLRSEDIDYCRRFSEGLYTDIEW